MLCAADSPAKISPPPDQAGLGLQDQRADCGQRWSGLFAIFHLRESSWKIPQLSLFEGSIECFRIWPRWGLMLAGECFRQPMLAHDTSVRGYGSSERIGTPIKSARARSSLFTSGGQILNPYELCKKDGGLPKSEWIEELMGWPQGWSGLEPLEMGKFQQWLQWHGKF